jgi:uncharacterized protein
MKLEQSFTVNAPVEQVWAALVDVERVAPCLPGAEITGQSPDGGYEGTFTVKLGPATASYRGSLKMESLDEDARVATMTAKGTDKRGQGGANASIVSTLRQDGEETVVEVVTDFVITGRLARFGRGGMIEDISKRLMRDFAGCLQTTVGREPAAAAEPVPPSSESEQAEAAVASAGGAAAEAAAAGEPPEPLAEPPAAAPPGPRADEPAAAPTEPLDIAPPEPPAAAPPGPRADEPATAPTEPPAAAPPGPLADEPAAPPHEPLADELAAGPIEPALPGEEPAGAPRPDSAEAPLTPAPGMAAEPGPLLGDDEPAGAPPAGEAGVRRGDEVDPWGALSPQAAAAAEPAASGKAGPAPRTGSIPPPSAAPRPAPQPAKPVKGFSLLLGVLFDRIKRFFAGLFKRLRKN